MGFQAFSW